jgi:hypothetical protein
MAGLSVKVYLNMFSQPTTCCVMSELHPYEAYMTSDRIFVESFLVLISHLVNANSGGNLS